MRIELTDPDQIEDFMPWNEDGIATGPNGETYSREAKLDAPVGKKRWASIWRSVWMRVSDGTYWAFDWEESDTEEHEDWSYIKPGLVQVMPEKVTTISWTEVK